MSSFPIHWCTVCKINIKVLEKKNNYEYMTRDVGTCESAVFPTCTLCHYIPIYDNMHGISTCEFVKVHLCIAYKGQLLVCSVW